MNKLQKLVQNYLKGDSTPGEIKAVHDWYDSFEQDQDPLDILSVEERQLLKQRLLSNIQANTTYLNRPAAIRQHVTRKLIYTLSGIAAIWLIITSLIFFQNRPAVISPDTTFKVVTNSTGSIQKIMLTDGSIVWLNPKSKIEFPEKFAISQRDIRLKGEAFFEVTPDKKRPFIITSGQVITRVWGTSFRVRAFEKLPLEVSVVTGKVSVRLDTKDNSEVMLLPDQKATYLKQTNTLKKESEKKTSAMRIWKKTSMSFDNSPIKEVIHSLNSTFGVHIRSDDQQLLSYVLKADFTDQSLPSILEMLEKSLDLKYIIQNREIILTTNN